MLFSVSILEKIYTLSLYDVRLENGISRRGELLGANIDDYVAIRSKLNDGIFVVIDGNQYRLYSIMLDGTIDNNKGIKDRVYIELTKSNETANYSAEFHTQRLALGLDNSMLDNLEMSLLDTVENHLRHYRQYTDKLAYELEEDYKRLTAKEEDKTISFSEEMELGYIRKYKKSDAYISDILASIELYKNEDLLSMETIRKMRNAFSKLGELVTEH